MTEPSREIDVLVACAALAVTLHEIANALDHLADALNRLADALTTQETQ